MGFVTVQLLQSVRLQSFPQGLRLDRVMVAGLFLDADADRFQVFADELLQSFGGRRIFLALDIVLPPLTGIGQ